MIISFREKYLLKVADPGQKKNDPNGYPWNASMESKVDRSGQRAGDTYVPDSIDVTSIKINKKLLHVKENDKKFLNWETINQLDSGTEASDDPADDGSKWDAK